jgi:hypothetical protein
VIDQINKGVTAALQGAFLREINELTMLNVQAHCRHGGSSCVKFPVELGITVFLKRAKTSR